MYQSHQKVRRPCLRRNEEGEISTINETLSKVETRPCQILRETGDSEENAAPHDVLNATISCLGEVKRMPKTTPIVVMKGFFYSLVVYMDNENEKWYYVVEVIEHG